MNYSCKNEIVDKIIQFFNALIEILYDCMYRHNRHINRSSLLFLQI